MQFDPKVVFAEIPGILVFLVVILGALAWITDLFF